MKNQMTLGVVVGNRNFFPAHLIESGRKSILDILKAEGIEAVVLSPEESENGGVSNLDEAKKCAALFKSRAADLDGILVTLPNFGDERSVANAIRMSGLKIPVLVHAFPDDPAKMSASDRRDGFCGKLSVCNNLKQRNIPFSLTSQHTMAVESDSFRSDLRRFATVCRVVKGLSTLRVGAIGARPAAFDTVRYSEKILELQGISVETCDLSEIFGLTERLSENEPALAAKHQELKAYCNTAATPAAALDRMARLAVVIDRWMTENDLQISALQCWTSMEENYGITPCTVMSMMSDRLMSSACEVDVMGAIAMYALGLASGAPGMLLDWNNNYGDDPDKAVLFHCSNLPCQAFSEKPSITYSDIFADSVGQENAYGTLCGRIKPVPFSFLRLSTDDRNGAIGGYVGEGRFTEDALSTFGGYGVAHIPRLQGLLELICRNGFEHHVAVSEGETADILHHAMTTYLGWPIMRHE